MFKPPITETEFKGMIQDYEKINHQNLKYVRSGIHLRYQIVSKDNKAFRKGGYVIDNYWPYYLTLAASDKFCDPNLFTWKVRYKGHRFYKKSAHGETNKPIVKTHSSTTFLEPGICIV